MKSVSKKYLIILIAMVITFGQSFHLIQHSLEKNHLTVNDQTDHSKIKNEHDCLLCNSSFKIIDHDFDLVLPQVFTSFLRVINTEVIGRALYKINTDISLRAPPYLI